MDPEMNITVVDVYDIASWIGKEFEKLIDSHGPELVRGLMPKVICALEHLEALAAKYETEDSELDRLKGTIEQLQNEKQETAEHRHRFEQVSSQGQVTFNVDRLTELKIKS